MQGGDIVKKWFKRLYRSKESLNIDEIKYILENNTNVVLLDVRSPQEYEEGHLKGAINIPTYELYTKARKIIKDPDTIVIAYCTVGVRSETAIKILRRLGYKNLYHLNGGIG